MKRQPESGNSNSPGKGAPSAAALKSLRSQIDKLDLQVLKLVSERASLAAQIGQLKNDQGAEPIFQPAREEEVLQNVLDANTKNKGPLSEESIRAIFREIMSASRALQKLLKVAYLGPADSFSHLAAIERFGQAVSFLEMETIQAVFEEVNRGHADFGVVPLDNSTDGRIADTLEMFMRLPQVKIGAEVRLRIHHNLLANCEQPEVRRVYSRAQALSQCRNWLAKNLPHATPIAVSSTSVAAQTAARENGSAAIASRQAASRYGLRVLFPDIEDLPHNETRFAVIGHQKTARTGKDKTAVMFRVTHQPGALVGALDVFKQAKINLSWIESFPARVPKSEYVFFIDFEGHIDDAKVTRTLKALQEHCEEVTVLGSFPQAEVSG
jgi:chorismate mutase / prephenate dehydratase